ncbi:NYN domain-containing protein [Maricaulis sp.]|uniref:LabA-like NYN domain-containing protein n=1 Tax=Maricaulis sp. TaxID=1486257 RepID=UPI00262ABCBC|nr:NYN domain-containing protein [Maricaulis sp.]
MTFYPDERIGLFIDGANVFSTTKSLDFDIDFKRLLDEFRKRGRLLRANYYTALLEQDDYNPLKPLVDWLDYNGFSVVSKRAKEFTDDQGRRRIKGDMDIELAIDMVEAADYLDHIILFSGDGDFCRAVKAVQNRGTRVSVVSSLRTSPPMIADELRRVADNFIELRDLEHMIGRGGE